MISNKEQTDTGIICITGTGSTQSKSIMFYSESNLQKLFSADYLPVGVQLLYYRHFDTIFDALAHKLMLESLCDTSLNCVISRMNPGWEDLHGRLLEDIEILDENT